MSSEAVERALGKLRHCAKVGRPVRGGVRLYATARLDTDECVALLAEIAKLERERDEARENNNAAGGVIATLDDARRTAEAALAVAREREQRAALTLADFANPQNWAIDRNPIYAHPKCVWIGTYAVSPVDHARAALVDEPAAAIGRQAVDDYRQDLAKLAESQTVASVGQPPASAAADEPGETPA